MAKRSVHSIRANNSTRLLGSLSLSLLVLRRYLSLHSGPLQSTINEAIKSPPPPLIFLSRRGILLREKEGRKISEKIRLWRITETSDLFMRNSSRRLREIFGHEWIGQWLFDGVGSNIGYWPKRRICQNKGINREKQAGNWNLQELSNIYLWDYLQRDKTHLYLPCRYWLRKL